MSGARYDKHFPERPAATSTVRRTLGQSDDIGPMIEVHSGRRRTSARKPDKEEICDLRATLSRIGRR
jgi:hypothetical protein